MNREKEILESLASVDIFDQKQCQIKREEEWEGFRKHGGLGHSFYKKFKLTVLGITLLLAVAGIYIFFRLPQMKSAYFTVLLSIGLIVAVYYWRKVVDQSME
ncbi:MAG: hypothetical protein K8T10_00320 [Candidatus Eremiobacteraeota bacterium]|nr:hypothetical protein [Candidatus Eremiobacteraeota bacterium]